MMKFQFLGILILSQLCFGEIYFKEAPLSNRECLTKMEAKQIEENICPFSENERALELVDSFGEAMKAEKLIPRVGVGVLVLKEGMVLLGRRKGSHGAGEWAPPGGHLEFGEEVVTCGERELLEETGLKALSSKSSPYWVENRMESKHYITLFVIVNEFEGEVELLEPEKCAGWHWFDLNSLPDPLFPPIRSLIERQKESVSSIP